MTPRAAGATPGAAPPDPTERLAPGEASGAPIALALAAFMTMLPVTVVVAPLKELVADAFGASSFWTHSFMSCNLVGAILAAPLIAAACDRSASRARVAGTALVADGALFAAMSAAGSLPVLLALRTLEGAAHMLALSALMAMAADRAGPARRGRTMGLLGASMMFGTAAGTRLGGVLWRSWPQASFEAAAVAAAAAAGFVALFVRDGARCAARRSWTEAWASVLEDRRLAIPYVFTAIDRFCVGVIISTFVLFLAAHHGLSPDARSRLLVLFLLPFALLVYPAGRLVDRVGPVAPLLGGSALFGLLFAGYGFFPAAALPAVMVVSGVVSAVKFAPTLALCAALSAPDRRGAAFAGFNAAGSLGFLCGPLAAGAVTELFGPVLGTAGGYRAAFMIAGALEVAVVGVTFRTLIRTIPHRAAQPEAAGRGAVEPAGRSMDASVSESIRSS